MTSAAATYSEKLDYLLASFQPLLTPEQAGFLLDDCSETHIENLIDEGKLAAVNIAGLGAKRRRLRIYRYSVAHRIMIPQSLLSPPDPEHIFPHERLAIHRRELATWFSCTEQHISNLNLPGPRDAFDTRHRIHRSAIVDFLRTRIIS